MSFQFLKWLEKSVEVYFVISSHDGVRFSRVFLSAINISKFDRNSKAQRKRSKGWVRVAREGSCKDARTLFYFFFSRASINPFPYKYSVVQISGECARRDCSRGRSVWVLRRCERRDDRDAYAGVATFDGTVPVGRLFEMAETARSPSPSSFLARLVFSTSPESLDKLFPNESPISPSDNRL